MSDLDQCPKCGKTVDNGSDHYYKGDIYMLEYDCDCGTSWYAIYKYINKEIIE